MSSLTVDYGATRAVDDVSFTVAPGEVVALLGPNGAGKTTTLACLEGYRHPTSGSVRVAGFDPIASKAEVVAVLGVMLQGGGVYPAMRVAETIALFAAYYPNPRDPRELMARLRLDHVASTPWRRLSGGEQQRLSLALALVGRPSVLLLDEPTAGVDPEGRLVIRAVVDELCAEGAAVLLTSHELAEVEAMASRHVFLARGRVRFAGTTAELAQAVGAGGSFDALPDLDVAPLAAQLGTTVREVRPGHYQLGRALSPSEVGHVAEAVATAGGSLDRVSAGGDLADLYHALYADEPPAPAPAPARRRRR